MYSWQPLIHITYMYQYTYSYMYMNFILLQSIAASLNIADWLIIYSRLKEQSHDFQIKCYNMNKQILFKLTLWNEWLLKPGDFWNGWILKRMISETDDFWNRWILKLMISEMNGFWNLVITMHNLGASLIFSYCKCINLYNLISSLHRILSE